MNYQRYQNNNLLSDPLLNEGKLIKFCEKMRNKKNIRPVPEMKDVSKINLDQKNLSLEEIKLAAQWAAVLSSNDFKMTSLRKIFNMFPEDGRINITKTQFILAYEVARKKQLEEFGEFLEELLNKTKGSQERSKKLKVFLEAIIAYHKLIKPKE